MNEGTVQYSVGQKRLKADYKNPDMLHKVSNADTEMIFGLYWILGLSTFLAADYFKIPCVICSLHHVLHNQHLCFYGIPTVYHILTSSPTEVFIMNTYPTL